MIQQKLRSKQVVWSLTIAFLLTAGAGCANNQADRNGQRADEPVSRNASIHIADQTAMSKVSVYSERGGLAWVPLKETASSLGFNLHKVDNGYAIGKTDAAFTVQTNQNQALAGDRTVELPQAPRLFGNKPYITTKSLSKLMGTPVKWNSQKSRVIIDPIDDKTMVKRQSSTASRRAGMNSTGTMRSLNLTPVNKAEVINFAMSFRGTPYEFSAGPYEQTQRFDCSSFVQFVYARFGVSLPRASRSQAEVGQNVPPDQLQPGDLMFFYTPGRYESNRIVGHVGLYAGNGQIVHTYGDPGVTVTPFDQYWQGRFLFAKRVA